MKKHIYIVLILLQVVLCSFGQRTISDWVELGVINTKEIQSVTLYCVENKKDTIKIETNKYNSKGSIIEEIGYPTNKFSDIDSVYKIVYIYDEDNLTLKERCTINDESKDTIDQIKYKYFYSDKKLIKKTTSYLGLDYLEVNNYFYNEKGILNQEIEDYLPESDKTILNDEYYKKTIWKYDYDKYGFLSEKTHVDSAYSFSYKYTNDSLGNILSFNCIGCDYDCDGDNRYFIKYDTNNRQILKEELNGCGYSMLTKYYYNNNQLVSLIQLVKYQKRRYRYHSKFGNEPPPPPPIIGPKSFEKKYRKYCTYICFYDSKGKLIRFTETNYRFRQSKNFILKYE